MSEQQQPVQQVIVQQAASNGLGTAGFVLSLVGLLTCGFLCPLGFLFGLLGMFKPPRGLAIAGTVIGALGSLWLAFFGFALVAGLFGFGSAVNEAMKAGEKAAERQRQEMKLEEGIEGAGQITLDPDTDDTGIMQQDAPTDSEAADPMLTGEQTPEHTESSANENDQAAEDAPPVSARDEYRTWTDASGSFRVRAKLSGRMDNSVRLVKEDGSTVTVPLDKLSEEDLKFLEESK